MVMSAVLIVALAMIVGIICLVKKCNNKRINDTIAESVQRQERPANKADFDDLAAPQQYQPRSTDPGLVGTAPATPSRDVE